MLRQQIPFFSQIPLYATKIKGEGSNLSQGPTTTKLLSSPKTLTKLAPVAAIVMSSPKTGPMSKEETKSDLLKGQKSPRLNELNTEVIRLPNTIKKASETAKGKSSSDVVKSPSLFLRSIANELSGEQIFCECGNVCEGSNTLCASCIKSKETIEHSGFLYIKSKEAKLKRYYYKLLNKELYCIFLLNLYE